MSSRKAVWVAAAAIGATLTLTAASCNNPNNPTPNNTGSTTATTAPTDAPPTSTAPTNVASPTRSSGMPGGTWTPNDGLNFDGPCGEPMVPTGKKVVHLTKPATATAISATDVKWGCDQGDPFPAPTGAEKTYTFAANAKAALHHENNWKPVSLTELADHSTKCLSHKDDPASPCSGAEYVIALDSSGKITQITEFSWPGPNS